MAIAIIATSANAVAFKWTSDSIKFGTTAVGAGATGYLVYIGNNTLNSTGYKFDDIVAMDDVVNAKTKLSKMNVTAANVDTLNNPVGNYVMYLTYTSGTDTFFNVSSTTYTLTQSAVTALLNEGTDLPEAKFSGIASTINAKGTAGTIGGGWYAVPEPGTAALALLGIGMLIRRRRA